MKTRLCDIPDWKAQQRENGGFWEVREKMGDEYVMLILASTEENCRMAAIGPWALRLLGDLIKSDNSESSRTYIIRRAQQLLNSAGIEI